ncbi:phosphoglucosamine mutase [Seinonella peptonophila]|uniref:Phosphoglucosamine mutase n=1 Tax=Seinonella peptonophila TaxID=112248 RepID=A0A1M5BCH1_9BACL|nr:phosphoglucosamine mutase [Seinonella peptonophila]SHF40115.1 phosphoglucosamine mutase [Seinonella peptonophila]
MGKYFGTDGVRGIANQELTPELAFKLGRTGAYVITSQTNRAKVVIGRDSRLSGEMLESALTAGFLSMGIDVILLGIVSTPAVAYLTRYLKAEAGVMISASHNPYPDNGIKFFNSEGHKLSDEMEERIETLLDDQNDTLARPTGENLGRIIKQQGAIDHYLDYLATTIDTDLKGLHVVMDGANGAAYQLAPQLLERLGVKLTKIHTDPNGVNINQGCGSTHPEDLQKAVQMSQAQIGIAFDGDADRLIAVDEKGKIVDGDQIMAICAKYLSDQQKLAGNTVVTTVMSNIGFFKSMENLGIQSVQTAVGDRFVAAALRKGNFTLGGEQSGHIIFTEYSNTGDGLLSALQLLQVLKATGKKLSELSQVMTKYPQLMKNVKVKTKEGWQKNKAIAQAIKEAEHQLKDSGRVLVRPSGTEPLIRVMAEGPDEEVLNEYINQIAQVIEQELG